MAAATSLNGAQPQQARVIAQQSAQRGRQTAQGLGVVVMAQGQNQGLQGPGLTETDRNGW